MLSALAVAGSAAGAFSPATTSRGVGLTTAAISRSALLQLSVVEPTSSTTEDCGCADNSDGSVQMNGVAVSGSSLRSTVLADTSGARVPVSSLIGDEGKAVVVFLRHLG